MDDPWKHRSTGMKCSTCMWYVAKQTTLSNYPEIGRCRRHSPTMNGYPVVYPTDWCGDHKLDETKTQNEKTPVSLASMGSTYSLAGDNPVSERYP